MAPVLTVRAYTGEGAATESDPQTGVTLLSADTASADPDSAKVAPGNYSYERWLRLKVDDPDGMEFTDFSITRDGDLPDGVEIRFGVTDVPATPRNTVSQVATKEMQDGRRYIFDAGVYGEAGQATRYLVVQEHVAADAASGAIPEQVFTIGYTFGPASG